MTAADERSGELADGLGGKTDTADPEPGQDYDYGRPLPSIGSAEHPWLAMVVHFDVALAPSSTGLAKSTYFANGRPTDLDPWQDTTGITFCRLEGRSAVTVARSEPIEILWAYQNRFQSTVGNHTTSIAQADLTLARNAHDLEAIACDRRLSGDSPDLSISYQDIRDAFASERWGTFVGLLPHGP